MWYSIIYIIIGTILSAYWWNKQYKAEYDELKKIKNNEDGMAVMLLAIMCIFWPFILSGEIYLFVKDKYNSSKKSV